MRTEEEWNIQLEKDRSDQEFKIFPEKRVLDHFDEDKQEFLSELACKIIRYDNEQKSRTFTEESPEPPSVLGMYLMSGSGDFPQFIKDLPEVKQWQIDYRAYWRREQEWRESLPNYSNILEHLRAVFHALYDNKITIDTALVEMLRFEY